MDGRTKDSTAIRLDIFYGPDQQRKKSVFSFNGKNGEGQILKTKFFSSGPYEEEVTLEGTRHLHYVSGGDGLAAVVDYDGENKRVYYILKDHLGSWYAVTDETGHIVTHKGTEQRYSFDPWGRRRNATTWSYDATPSEFLFDRGFTGHEHLDGFGLINMNGRVYDPVLARFLSPDPIVQAPGYGQSYNRYSYCWNNPLESVDPSGYYVAHYRLSSVFELAGDPVLYYQAAGAYFSQFQTFSSGGSRVTSFSNRMNKPAPYVYDWTNNCYRTGYGTQVTYDEVYYNYISKYATVIYDANSHYLESPDKDFVIGGGVKGRKAQLRNFGGITGLTVETYRGYNRDKTRTGWVDQGGGIVIEISYLFSNLFDVKWVQRIYTDSPLDGKTSPYWDSFNGSMYYPNQWTEGNTLFFYDNPSRNSDCSWRAVLSLTNGANVIFSLYYGFNLNKGEISVIPIRVVYP